MATDPLDGDVKRLRFSGSRGRNGDPIGLRPLRSEGGSGRGGDAVNDARLQPDAVDIASRNSGRPCRARHVALEDSRCASPTPWSAQCDERQVLEERVSALTEQLRVSGNARKAMNEALVAAQQLRRTRAPPPSARGR